MEAIDQKVGNLSSSDRSALEHLFGRPLASDDHVVVVAYQPHEGQESVREAARARILATLERAAQHATTAGVTAEEADSAIMEAMAAIRPRASN